VRRCVVAIIFVALFAGCSHQGFNRPYSSYVTDLFDSGKPYLPPGETAAERRTRRLSEILAARASVSTLRQDKYSIGVKDVLQVSIIALHAPDKETSIARTVDKEGKIALPHVGRVAVAGGTVLEARQRIIAAYAKDVFTDPQITVRVAQYRSAFVVVAGEVDEPGTYYLSSDKESLLSILGKAGGPNRNAGEEVLIRRRVAPLPATVPRTPGQSGDPAEAASHTIIHVDLQELIDKGNLLSDVPLIHGDVVTVPTNKGEFVYVLGYVPRPRRVSVRHGRIAALRAIAMAGGLLPMARPENSRVMRERADTRRAEVTKVDLTKIVRGVRPPLYLRPGDTLVVGSNIFARLAEFVRPTASAGASLAVAPP